MEFWSKGLGRRSLNIACGTEAITQQDEQVLLTGTVGPPLSWEYTIVMDADDWLGFFEVAFHPVVLRHLTRPRRLGVALRAGLHLIAFLALYVACLPLALLGAAKTADGTSKTAATSPPRPREREGVCARHSS